MKKLKVYFLAFWMMIISLFQSGCFASFPLTSNIWEWNDSVDGKFVNLLIFYAFVIIPVYELALLADIIVFNSIEFWTGKDPLAMKKGEEDNKIVMTEDKTYRITARKNQFEIEQLKGPEQGEKMWLNFYPQENAWYVKTADKNIKLAEYETSANGLFDQVNLFKPNGEKISVNAYANNQKEVRRFVEQQLELSQPY
jgi:hypothetical protein